MASVSVVKAEGAKPSSGAYLSGRALYWRGFWSGITGTVVMVIVMLVFNWLFGLETLPDRLQQISIKVLPGQFFEFGIQTFGQAAKPIQLIVITVFLILAGGFLGMLYVRLFGKHSAVAADDPAQPASMFRDGTLWRNALIYAVALWVAFYALIIPLLEKTLASDSIVYRGVGVFGTNYHAHDAGLVGMYSGPVAYSLLTLLMFLSFGLVNAFVFHQDVVATTCAWREQLAASSLAADAPSAPSPSRRRTLRYIAGGIAAVFAAIVAVNAVPEIGLGAAGTNKGTGRPGDAGTNNTPVAQVGPTDTPEPPNSGTPVAGNPTPAAAGTQLSDAGMPSDATSNRSFYHVSKNSQDPVVSRNGWTLSVEGSVDKPYTLTYADLVAMPTIERYLNLSCISNPVGGGLIGAAKWKGIPLASLLQRAGVKSSAQRVIFKAADDYTDSITVETAMHSYNLLATSMNGVDLPDDHGAPARLLIPGIYGMKNVKWLNTIIVSDDGGYKGFWQAQGWDNAAPTRTMSIFYIPQRDSTQPNKPLLIGGIAYAGDRGVSKVEVSADGGQTWNPANLRTPKSPYSWVLWTWPWTPKGAGQYTIQTRATDGKGTLQRSDVTDAYPFGVEAYDTMKVTIAG